MDIGNTVDAIIFYGTRLFWLLLGVIALGCAFMAGWYQREIHDHRQRRLPKPKQPAVLHGTKPARVVETELEEKPQCPFPPSSANTRSIARRA